MTTCKSCGAQIQFVITKTGKKMPLDAKPRRFYVIQGGMPVQFQGHEPHFATCPKADRFKKKKEKPAVTDYGWANGWGDQTPELVRKCRELGHEVSDEKIDKDIELLNAKKALKSDAPGVPYRCFTHTVRCDICGYHYKYDSS
jgi:hypothetical protein